MNTGEPAHAPQEPATTSDRPWTLKGISDAERNAVIAAAQAAGQPLGRYVATACMMRRAWETMLGFSVDLAAIERAGLSGAGGTGGGPARRRRTLQATPTLPLQRP